MVPTRWKQREGSNDSVARLFEDPERPGAKGNEVAFGVVDFRLGGGGPASAVEDLALASYAPATDRAQEVHVHLNGRCPHAHERQHREAHSVVYERGVDPTMQRAGAIEVDILDVDAYNRTSWLDLLDLRPYMPGECDLVVKVLCEIVQLLFTQGTCIFSHRTPPI